MMTPTLVFLSKSRPSRLLLRVDLKVPFSVWENIRFSFLAIVWLRVCIEMSWSALVEPRNVNGPERVHLKNKCAGSLLMSRMVRIWSGDRSKDHFSNL